MSIRPSALAALRDGRVTVGIAQVAAGTSAPPYTVTAKVLSSRMDGTHYWVRLKHGEWSCTCTTPLCAHLAAVQLVTGHPSPARKEAAS